MGSKKAKKAADPATEGKVAEAQVHESESKKKKRKVKPTSEIDDIFGQKAPVEEPDKTVKAKAKSEIDDIFGQKKRRKAEGEHDEAAQAAAKKKDRENSEVVKLYSKGELVKPKKPKVATATASAKSTPGAAPTSRKKTEDGFTVYSAVELGFNKKNAGGTKLCPFDCYCCF